MTEAEHLYKQAEALALQGIGREESSEARGYVRRIVDDWFRQADEEAGLERENLFEIGLSDLRRDIEGKVGAQRLPALQMLALKPSVQRISGRAFELARRIADGEMTRETAADTAAEIGTLIDGLAEDVKLLHDEEGKRLLLRSLADADLEVRFVLEEEEGAISLRLNRYLRG